MLPVCPKCDVGLIIVHLQTVAVDFCDRCHGLWLDAGEVEQLLAQTGARADEAFLAATGVVGPASSPTRQLCPRCDQPLDEVRYGDLVLDRCPAGHGLWFDRNDLPRWLAQLPAEARAAKTIDYLNQLFVKPV